VDHHTHTCYAALLRSARVLCSTASVFHGAARLRVKSSLVQPPLPPSRALLFGLTPVSRALSPPAANTCRGCAHVLPHLCEGLNPTHSRLTPARHFRWDRSLCCPALTPGLDSLFPAHICAGTGWAHPLSAVSAGTGWAHPRPPSALGQARPLPHLCQDLTLSCPQLREESIVAAHCCAGTEWTHPIPHLRSTAGLPRLPPPLVLVGFLLAC
jgi:hypothetical protein